MHCNRNVKQWWSTNASEYVIPKLRQLGFKKEYNKLPQAHSQILHVSDKRFNVKL